MHPVWHEFEKMVSQVVKKNNSEENICRKIFFLRNDFIVYPTQYSKIVIRSKILCLSYIRIMDFLKIVYVQKGGHWVWFSSPPFSCPSPAFSCHSSRFSCSSSPVSLLLFSPSFHGLPSVPFLLFYTLLCFLPGRILSPYPYHFLLSLIPVVHPLFLSRSTLLPQALGYTL